MEDMLLTHHTDSRNVGAIRQKGVLLCALALMNAREKTFLAEKRRPGNTPVSCGAVLRNQQALKPAGLFFSDGAKFADFVRYLNGHVFFWPDNAAGNRCRGYFCEKHRHPDYVGLRCRFADLRDANAKKDILFSPCSAGATPGDPEKSPRYLGLFQPVRRRTVRRLVEIVVRDRVCLPKNTEVEEEKGKWRPLF